MSKNVEFADLTEAQIAYIESAEFNPVFVTGKQVEEATSVLELDGKSEGELHALRNAVVRHLSTLTSAKRDQGDSPSYNRLSVSLSALTAVIDNRIYAA